MKKTLDKFKVTRRQVLKAGLYGGAGMMLPLRFLPAKAFAQMSPGDACTILGCTNFKLSDPSKQPKFVEYAPNALNPDVLFMPLTKGNKAGQYNLVMRQTEQETGLLKKGNGPRLKTKVWGYGDENFVSWPGRTISAQSGTPITIRWDNDLPFKHLFEVDTNLHWAYSLHGYETYTIKNNGVPVVTHLHGGHTDFQFDGNPEFFWSPDYEIVGPSWFNNGLNGIVKDFVYANDQPAGNLWYHDHGLGITRLNVYAGLAGFYFVRDLFDTGAVGNPAQLPAYPYELAYAIQDRMFTDNGDLFYPAFPSDPFYFGFITEEGAILPPDLFPKGGPTALAEFFGDHMVVNGRIWPKEDVEPRNYRMHLLNGTDSRFMAIRFREVGLAENAPDTIPDEAPILSFKVVGSDQGLAYRPDMVTSAVKTVNQFVFEPGGRYDIVFDFRPHNGKRIIMENIGGDEPFGGDLVTDDPALRIFECTDRIMAFDVVLEEDTGVPDVTPTGLNYPIAPIFSVDRTRKVALFEGKDEFGRLQPLLGTAEPATDYQNPVPQPINWPATPVYQQARLPNGTLCPLTGQMEGSIAWHSPTTENPALDSTEEWEIWNMTGDAHPVHLHLVHFEIVNRQEINLDSNTDEDGFIEPTMYAIKADTPLNPDSLTVSINANIPTETANSGKIVVVNNNGDEIQVGYSSYTVDTFTLNEAFGYNAAAGNTVYVPVPADDGVYLVSQPTVQHNSVADDATTYGMGFKILHPSNPSDGYGDIVPDTDLEDYVENAPKDMVTALPGQITRIRARFDKVGRYVWHCHILSHEDHEMMRVLHVGPEPVV